MAALFLTVKKCLKTFWYFQFGISKLLNNKNVVNCYVQQNEWKLGTYCLIPYIWNSRKDKIIVTESVSVSTRDNWFEDGFDFSWSQ